MRDKLKLGGLLAGAVLLCNTTAYAGGFQHNTGKVLATGGVSMIDGAGGGGITPWATITGYGTKDGINGDVHYTYANLPNYSLNSLGVAIGFWDRFELSYAYSYLPTGSTFNTVGLATSVLEGAGASEESGIESFNTTIEMESYGAKLRLFGDAIYNSDSLIPQVAVGGFYKINKNDELLTTLKAAETKDWEAYIAATKIFFPWNTLINVTARYTSANQTGLTGFGGPEGNKKEIRPEVSLAYLLNKRTVIGVEYAKHGDNLSGESVQLGGLEVDSLFPILEPVGLGGVAGDLTQEESDWYDAFVAFFPSKNLSITAAYAHLGDITITPDQYGFYLSLQASF
jgi:hypothetical protein